jgi:hypothetical protein
VEVVTHSGGVADVVHPYLAVVGLVLLNSVVVGAFQRRRAKRRAIADPAGGLRRRHELNERRPTLQQKPGRE